MRRKKQIGAGEESALFGGGISPLGHADLRKDRVYEGVAVATFGKENAAVIDFDPGDRIESEDVADQKSTLFAITA